MWLNSIVYMCKFMSEHDTEKNKDREFTGEYNTQQQCCTFQTIKGAEKKVVDEKNLKANKQAWKKIVQNRKEKLNRTLTFMYGRLLTSILWLLLAKYICRRFHFRLFFASQFIFVDIIYIVYVVMTDSADGNQAQLLRQQFTREIDFQNQVKQTSMNILASRQIYSQCTAGT